MNKTIITMTILAGLANGVYAGIALDSLKSAGPTNDLRLVLPSVPALAPLRAAPVQSTLVNKDNLPGHYVAKLAIEGPYMAVEMIVNKDFTIKVKEGNMDQVSPWFSGKWEFNNGKFAYTCNAPGFENNKTIIDMSGVSRAALKAKDGVQVMVLIGGQNIPFRLWETDRPFFPAKERGGAAIMKGSIALEGKNLPVSITYRTFPSDSRILVGPMVFVLTDEGKSFGGYRKAAGVDQNVMISPVTDDVLKDPQQAAKEFGIANYKEIKCSKDDYFLMLGDNLTGKMIANCVKLR